MIAWIDAACRTWGLQKRRILQGGTGGHLDGWPPKTLLGRLREEGPVGACGGGGRGPCVEVLTGDGLRVARAVAGAPEDVRDVLAAHYVLRGPVRQKALLIGARDRRQYYGRLARAHTWIEARWDL